MPPFYLGLDLGGTNVKAGVTDDTGRLITKVSVPTGSKPSDLAPGLVIDRMIAAANQVIGTSGIARSDVAAMGILAPGQASLSKGVIIRSANLPLWKNVHLRAKVARGLNLPGVLENDANAAAYGEYWAGAGKNKKLDNLFMFTLGTGVGGGLVYEGRVVRGSSDFAAEIGHMIIVPGGEPCGCGQHGCLERYCSGRYAGERAVKRLAASPKIRRTSSLGKIFKEKGTFTAADITQHARAGDKFARESWEEACRYLALACINVCHFIDPQMIVLAGGMSLAGKFLLDSVLKHFDREWWKMTRPTTKISLARLGNDAGVIGAAGVAKDAFDRKALPQIGR